MSHLKVVRGYLRGRYRRGARVFADRLDGAVYSHGRHFPLVVQIRGGFLVNGNRYSLSTTRHQSLALQALTEAQQRFAVVPFAPLELALALGRNNNRFGTPRNMREAVSIVVPSSPERWRSVPYQKPDGTAAHRFVHTLGDSVISVHDRVFVSAMDETGVGRGLYFLTGLPGNKTPSSVAEALEMLKPRAVKDAEREGLEVSRQGEWFAIPARIDRRKLLSDVRRGVAVHRKSHLLGRNGHHRLTEAVIYKHGPQKGAVFARGTMRHTRGEHRMLALSEWSRIVRNVQKNSISITANFD